MKKILLLYLISSSLISQELETDENEFIKINLLGFAIKGKDVSWMVDYSPKNNSIEKLEIRELNNPKYPLIIFSKNEIYSPGFKYSQNINPPNFDWIYENGLTTKPFSFKIYTKNGNHTLYKAYTFTEEEKIGWRKVIEVASKYKKEPKDIPNYHYLDFRKWILFNGYDNENATRYQYILESELNKQPKELFFQDIIKNETNLNNISKRIEKNVKEICPESTFKQQKLANEKIFYTITFNSCEGNTPAIELGSLSSMEGSILNVKYLNFNKNYPMKNISIWESILKKE